jgi:transcriptional regulator with XRE-family HTH domain
MYVTMNKGRKERFMKISCEKLRYYRKRSGLSSQEFAELCNIPIGTYFSYEAGSRSPKRERMNVIAEKLNVTIDDLTTSDIDYKKSLYSKGYKSKNSVLKERILIKNNLLRPRRKQLGLKTKDVAKYVGLSETRYRDYEQGYGNPTREMAGKICTILNLKFNELVIE